MKCCGCGSVDAHFSLYRISQARQPAMLCPTLQITRAAVVILKGAHTHRATHDGLGQENPQCICPQKGRCSMRGAS